MNPSVGLRFLRPCLRNDLPSASKAAYLRFFSTSHAVFARQWGSNAFRKRQVGERIEGRVQVQERIEELEEAEALQWPRISRDKDAMRVTAFREKYSHLKGLNGDQVLEEESVILRGRVKAIRIAGGGLVFMDLSQDGTSVQVVLNRKRMTVFGSMETRKFREFYHLVRRGDIICEFLLWML